MRRGFALQCFSYNYDFGIIFLIFSLSSLHLPFFLSSFSLSFSGSLPPFFTEGDLGKEIQDRFDADETFMVTVLKACTEEVAIATKAMTK